MPLPSVASYLDFRAYLTDWFNARKQADPTYSYARFGRDGGCSKAALANVIGGARLPRPATIDAFARAMSLNPTEHTMLAHLVDLEGARTQAERRQVMERILSAEKFGQVRALENETDEALTRFLEFWWVPVIRELATLPGFRDDPEWLASQMWPPITPEQAKSALDTLCDLEFLVRTDSGIETRELHFRTEPQVTMDALLHFHQEVLPKLMANIRNTCHDQQHLLTGTLLLSADVMPEVKAKLDALMSEVVILSESLPKEPGARVYQLTLQALPVSVTSVAVSEDSSS